MKTPPRNGYYHKTDWSKIIFDKNGFLLHSIRKLLCFSNLKLNFLLCLEIINWSCFWDTVLFCRATHNFHCVKRVRIRSYSGPFFYAFGLNNSEYGHFSRSVHLVLAEIIAKCNARFLKILEERFDEFL